MKEMKRTMKRISLRLRGERPRPAGDAAAALNPPHRVRALRAGHPWAYAGELEDLPGGEADTAALYDERGRFVASGVYNPSSKIAWRRYSFSDQELDAAFLRLALERAIEYRARFGMGDVCRLVWAESDALPGLVVDRYGDILVIQALTRALDARLPLAADILRGLLNPRAIVVRNDAKVRALEGLPCHAFLQSGELWPDESVQIDGMRFCMDYLGGQKTGLYLDQREQYPRVARYAGGRRVLDAFSNQGGFALFAARAGAREVTAVDSSASALCALRKNAEANGIRQIEAREQNVFDFFHANKDERWDLIILDPPPFAPTKRQLQSAFRGYKELNLRAALSLERGGILASYSCSHHVGIAEFTEIVRSAFADAGRSAHVLEYVRQPPDHPILLEMPESEYFCGLVVQCD